MADPIQFPKRREEEQTESHLPFVTPNTITTPIGVQVEKAENACSIKFIVGALTEAGMAPVAEHTYLISNEHAREIAKLLSAGIEIASPAALKNLDG